MLAFGSVITRQTVLQRGAELDAIAEILAVQIVFARLVVPVAVAVVHERTAQIVVLRVERTFRVTLRFGGAVDERQMLRFPRCVFALALGEARALVHRRARGTETHAGRFDTSFDRDTISAAVFQGRRALVVQTLIACAPRAFARAWTRPRRIGIGIDPTIVQAQRKLDAYVVDAAQGIGTIVCPGTRIPDKTTPKSVFIVGARGNDRP